MWIDVVYVLAAESEAADGSFGILHMDRCCVTSLHLVVGVHHVLSVSLMWTDVLRSYGFNLLVTDLSVFFMRTDMRYPVHVQPVRSPVSFQYP